MYELSPKKMYELPGPAQQIKMLKAKKLMWPLKFYFF